MTIPPVRRRWKVLAIVAVLVLVAVRLLDSPLRLDHYRLVDPQTLDVVGYGAPGAWTHMTSLVEGSTVTISVNVFTFVPGPSSSTNAPLDVTVHLSAPLDGRAVIDGNTGQPVPLFN
jgi:hypothetical protein